MDGVLVIDKPAGPTSHDVVARARRALGEKRIGHTGTLDPLATGVLPLVIGRATRLASMLSATRKSYDAAVRLGAATSTYDAAARFAGGTPPPDDPGIEIGQVEQVLGRFRGAFEQMPPPYSAKKVGGVAAYKLARQNKPTALTAVTVTVHELRLLGLDHGLLTLHVTASPGFYVRSLAHDLGQALGCGAHLEALRRTAAGSFGLDCAISLEALDGGFSAVASKLIPLEELVPDIPAIRLNDQGARKASHGNSLGPEDFAEPGMALVIEAGGEGAGAGAERPGRVRLLGPDGRLLGIAETAPGGLLRPQVVLV